KRIFSLFIVIALITSISLGFLSVHSTSPLLHHTAYADEKDNKDTDDNQDNDKTESVNNTEELIKKANNGETTEKEDDELAKLQKQNIVKNKGDKWVAGDAFEADSNLWTLYSRILMESGEGKDSKKEKEEDNGGGVQKMVKNAIGSFMGDGGVEVDIPFNEMYSIGKDLGNQNGNKQTNTQAGRQLASFFSTCSHNGY
uniref:hypothetical protein n=1 Tax=Staphylococcus haemolyticus TaxID=1283 RepID=UPI001C5CB633